MKNRKGRIVGFLLLSCCFVLAGCQPTPEKEAVVNKQEGIPSDALIEASGTLAPARDSYEPMAYKVSEHWKEDITKDERFTINADVDVMVPEAETFPTQKLKSTELTQERVEMLAAYFMEEDVPYYQMPAPLTKEYYEAEILRLKESLARVEAGGDGEDPASIREYIRQQEENYANAPDEVELTPAELKFTYRRDYDTGEPRLDTGENEIFIGGTGSDGVNRTIFAMRDQDGSGRNDFSYNAISATESEGTLLWQESYNENARAELEAYDEPYRSEQAAQLEQAEARAASLRKKLEKNTIDIDAMQKKAIALLKELDITGVQISQGERALYAQDTSPTPSGWAQEGVEATEPGCYFTFSRQSGGIPVVAQTSWSGSGSEAMEGIYSAPFYPESGSILFDTQGNVKSFMWNNLAQKSEQVSADSKVMPFAQAKERIADYLYWKCMPRTEQSAEIKAKETYRFEVKAVRLVMAYINVKNEPDAVMAVPAWYVGTQGYSTWFKEGSDYIMNGKEVRANEEQVMINALDGSPIIMPGIIQRMNEEAKGME